jgi:hypothetical protein
MQDFYGHCAGTWRAGENGFYLYPVANHVRIEHDSQAWIYNVERSEIKAFKAWAKTAFQKNGIPARISGSFPSYYATTTHCG